MIAETFKRIWMSTLTCSVAIPLNVYVAAGGSQGSWINGAIAGLLLGMLIALWLLTLRNVMDEAP